MSSSAVMTPTPLNTAARRIADYMELTKPRIALMALVTVAVGSFLASGSTLDRSLLFSTLLGTALVAAGASVLNQVLERESDALMRRTQNRPLPAGRVGVSEAVVFGGVLALLGVVYLSALVNVLTGLLGALTFALYVFVYTPLKRITSFNTLLGAIPGALPPVMGWAAVQNSVGVEAWSLFLILFLWQFPHFLAIAWIYREDYARAGLPMLPVLDAGGGMTARQMIGYSLVLLPASLAPSVLGSAGPMYFFGALALGLGLLVFALRFAWSASAARARGMLRASLMYLPALFTLMVLEFS